MNELLRVLIVEDSEDDAELLIIELMRGGYQPIYQIVDTETDMQQALSAKELWDIVLADYSMPQFSAIAALELLKAKELDLPFIIVSGTIGEDTVVKAMKAGAHDYIVKGKLARLIPAVERELKEAVLRKEHRESQARLRYLAFYDEVTRLPNLTLFLEYLNREIARSREAKNEKHLFAVIVLSIDRFVSIKQSLGYVVGKQLLNAVARRLETCIPQNHVIARIDGERFAILLTDIQCRDDAISISEKIYNYLITPFQLQDSAIFSTINIGIALSTINYKNAEKLLQAADTAMYYAQINFTRSLVVFDEAMHANAIAKLQLETDLQQAIIDRQLYLVYQPIVSLETSKIDCLEALARWQHSSLGSISPDRFIPLSEETGQIIPLGQWVLSEACSQLVDWRQNFNNDISFGMSINLSRIQISHPQLIPELDHLLASLNLKGEDLKLEITESILMENVSAITRVLEKLKERNIKLCIDDFGTGYSSLSYLRYLPVDTVKIDKSFIEPEGNKNYDIVKAIVDLAHSLELDVVAEGIETESQLKMLRELGCEYGQGYFFAYPLPSKDVFQKLQK